MDIALYLRYLNQFVKEAINNSDGTNMGVSNYLWEKRVSGLLVQHKEEKQKALDEARRAFDEHRQWPQDIVLSHLGVDLGEVKKK